MSSEIERFLAAEQAAIEEYLRALFYQLASTRPGSDLGLVDFAGLERAQRELALPVQDRRRGLRLKAMDEHGDLALVQPGLAAQRRQPN